MNHPYRNGIPFLPPNAFGWRPDALTRSSWPPILVGIQRDLGPALPFGGTRLQRMRVIVVEPRLTSDPPDAEADSPDEDSMAEVLPPWAPGGERFPAPHTPARPVLGEILRGEDGALYERFGARIRPLAGLAAGPHGEVLEVPESGEVAPRLRARVAMAPVLADVETDAGPTPGARGPRGETAPSSQPPGGDPAVAEAESALPACRPLLPEPGQWRVVRLGDFKPMLLSQLAHPERLRDTHRLPCYVQVFEVGKPQRLEELALAIFGEATATQEVRLVTPAIVQQLQLAPLLPPPPRVPRPASLRSALLLPHDRVFCLEVAQDPTEDRPAMEANHASTASPPMSDRGTGAIPAHEPRMGGPRLQPSCPSPDGDLARPQPRLTGWMGGEQSPPPAGPSGPPVNRRANDLHAPGEPLGSADPNVALHSLPPGLPPEATASAFLPLTTPTAPGSAAQKAGIPALFLKPWEFQVSREEALFELLRARSFSGRLRASLRRLAAAFRSRHELRLWQVRLNGKAADEQLWAVRPPKGGTQHPLVRAWAERTLEAAGYSPRPMLMEWELFWRRKGI